MIRDPIRKTVIRKPDLDTLAAAFILGIKPEGSLRVTHDWAESEELADPAIACIECGGDGQAHLNNFDHHAPGCEVPPACEQALGVVGKVDPWLAALAEYACAIDIAGPVPGGRNLPDLSAAISGLRLLEADPVTVFRKGLEMMRELRHRNIPPNGPLPDAGPWAKGLAARVESRRVLERDMATARYFTTAGVRWGVVVSSKPGGHGALRQAGCEISLSLAPAERQGAPRLATIASGTIRLESLLNLLNAMEPGWGGPAHGTIIGAPYAGTRLDPKAIERMIGAFLIMKLIMKRVWQPVTLTASREEAGK